MLWLLGIGSWLKSALSGVLRAVTANPWPAAVIALSLVCAMLWRADGHHRAQRDTAVAGRAADRASYVNAQTEAQAKAVAAKAATEAHYQTLAERTDHAAQIAIADADRRVDSYIAGHRVRDKTADRSASGAIATAEDSRAQGSDRPDTAANIYVPANDLRICATNTTRLEAVRVWAMGMAGK